MHDFKGITEKLKETIDDLSSKEWKNLLEENYIQFNLMNNSHEWISIVNHKNQELLLPRDFKKEAIVTFVEETRVALCQNDYLIELLRKIPQNSIKDYSPFILDENDSMDLFLKHLIAFSFCLEKINQVGRDDLSFMEEIVLFYRKKRKQNGFYRLRNVLAIIKLHSIEFPLVRFFSRVKKRKIEADFGKYILSFNIFEAMLVDLIVGKWDNAFATFPLIFFSPNYQGLGLIKKYKKGRESCFSDDGKALLMSSPAPKEWADLYQVWNMAFVSQFDQTPYLLAKLCIPSVSQYENRYEEYMHTRITALLLTMNYLDSAVNDSKIRIDLKKLKCAPDKLTRLWGEVNLDCSYKYINLIKQQK